LLIYISGVINLLQVVAFSQGKEEVFPVRN